LEDRLTEIVLIHEAKTKSLKKERASQTFWVALMWLFGAITVSILILVVGYVLVQGGVSIAAAYSTVIIVLVLIAIGFLYYITRRVLKGRGDVDLTLGA